MKQDDGFGFGMGGMTRVVVVTLGTKAADDDAPG
jgi:hypothetical protein